MQKAKPLVAKALQIDDAVPYAHDVAGIVRTFFEWDVSGGESEFRRAIELDQFCSGALRVLYHTHDSGKV